MRAQNCLDWRLYHCTTHPRKAVRQVVAMIEDQSLSDYLSVRVQPFLFNLLKGISQKTGLSKSELVRTAIITWLRTVPEDELPLGLKIRVSTLLVSDKVSLIKDLRFLYHARRKAENMKNQLEVSRRTSEFPPHVVDYLQKLEDDLVEIVGDFDKALMATPMEDWS